jgi:hypothetical protein
MTVAPANTSSIIVAVTGVLQDPSTYSVSGTTLTFSAAPPSGSSNISVRYLGIPASGVTTTAYRTVTDFTATAAQTSFSVPSYTVGYIDVYRNGVRLVSTDFTATTGTTVVLVNACTSGDSVVTESFLVSSVLNAIPATAGSVAASYLVDGSITQAKFSTNVAGNGPAFSAYQSSATSVSNATGTKILFGNETFDTNSNFASSRFTPTVSGYYQISASVALNITGASVVQLYMNTSTQVAFTYAEGISAVMPSTGVISKLLYFNGSTDYVEVFSYQNSGGSVNTDTNSAGTWFTGVLVRSA